MFEHIPVLLNETVALLIANGGTRFVDGTLGGGGHTQAILDALPGAHVLGLDRDRTAIQAAGERLAPYGDRFTACHTTFSNMRSAIAEHGWDRVDGILLDLGISSPQIDTPERGFSFRFDAPLDMRMNQDDPLTAADILNTASEKELADIFFLYGEEKKARKVAAAVVQRREKEPWKTTAEFRALCERCIPRTHQHGLPPATRCFQALRIAVNHELDELQAVLGDAIQSLNGGGRLAVISFHSLEDRIVKSTFREAAAACTCPPGLPICTCGKVRTVDIVTHKPITATDEELRRNPRAASAKLRVAERRRNP